MRRYCSRTDSAAVEEPAQERRPDGAPAVARALRAGVPPLLKPRAPCVDAVEIMVRPVIALLLLLLFAGHAMAQERHAVVRLEDGRSLTGRVLSMDLELLELEVGNEVMRIPAAEIRSCRFHVGDDPATRAGAAGEQESAGEGEAAGAADEPAAVEPNEPNISWTGPLPDPVDPTSPQAVPVDLRRSHWQSRIQALDAAYPWLAPAAPTQWISLGLLLLVGSGLVVHLSVRVAGAEAPELGRSVAVGVWYLATGLLQVAMVPLHDLSVTLMLLGNTTVGLFLLCGLFGLPRWGALVALMIQLGCGVVVYGILELVTALLGSCGVTV